MPSLPKAGPITVVPGWACEILSPRTRSYDLLARRPFCAEIGLGHLCYVDPDARSLTVSRLLEGKWLELGVFGRDQRVRAEPFDAIEIALGDWWEGLGEEEDAEP